MWSQGEIQMNPLPPQDMDCDIGYGEYPYTTSAPAFTPPPARLMAMPDFMLQPREPGGRSARRRKRGR